MADIERLVVGPLAGNCYIMKSGEELAVVDPGGDADLILERIAGLGGTVRYVLNTHGHIDHVAANRPVLEATGAKLLIHELDAPLMSDPDLNLESLIGFPVRLATPDRLLRRDDVVEVGDERLKVIHTPGHTPGGICLLGDGFAFTGDTLFLDSVGRIDLPGGSEPEMRASLLLLQATVPRTTMLYPGHNEPGTMARALLVNPFLGTGLH